MESATLLRQFIVSIKEKAEREEICKPREKKFSSELCGFKTASGCSDLETATGNVVSLGS